MPPQNLSAGRSARRRSRGAAALTAAALAGLCGGASAADVLFYTNPGGGEWNSATLAYFAWRYDDAGAFAFLDVPPPGAAAILALSGTNGISGGLVDFNYSYAGTNTLGSLTIDSDNALSQTTGTLAVDGPIQIAGTASGQFALAGGTATAQALTLGGATGTGAGSLTFNGGSLTIHNAGSNLGTLTVGPLGAGTVNHSDGTLTTDALVIASGSSAAGVYNMSNTAALIVGGDEQVGAAGAGTFTHTGGTHTIAGSLSIGDLAGASGDYALSGGSLTVARSMFIGNNGTGAYEQSGGSARVAGKGGVPVGLFLGFAPGASGTATISDGSLKVDYEEYVGYSGNGTLNQSGGANTAAYITVGWQPGGFGTVNLSGGSLSIASGSFAGFFGTGAFNQTGGTHTTTQLYVGTFADGLYSLSGGTLNVNGPAYVGYNGNGTMVQTGGVANIAGPLAIQFSTSNSGRLTVSGGSLSAASTINHGTFTLNGGGTASLGALSGTGATEVGLTGTATASLTVATFDQRSLQIGPAGIVRATGAAHATNHAELFSIAGAGILDLANTDLDVNGTNQTVADIRTYLASAYNGGAWTGTGGITSSLAIANPAAHSVGYATGDSGIVPGLATGRVLVRPTLTGDVNLDGVVDFNDVIQMLGSGKYDTGQAAAWTDGDLNYDGVNDFNDVLTLLNSGNYNAAGGPITLPASAASLSASQLLGDLTVHYQHFTPITGAPPITPAVPEPAGLLLVATAFLGLGARRRRRRWRPHPARGRHGPRRI